MAVVCKKSTQFQNRTIIEDLWQGQNLDANSLLALRCLSEDFPCFQASSVSKSAEQDQAMDLVGALYSKGRRNIVALQLHQMSRLLCQGSGKGGVGAGAFVDVWEFGDDSCRVMRQVSISNPNNYLQAPDLRLPRRKYV